MVKKKVNISLPSVDELFTSQVERDSKGSSVIQLLPVASIIPFPNHPFGVRDDQDMEQLVESIQEHGILSWRDGHVDASLEQRFPVGTRLRILPNHACATAAQFPHYEVLRADGSTTRWPRFFGW